MSKITDKAAREAAADEGLLGAEALQLPTKRWPRWAVTRYCGDDPRSGVDEIAEPLRMEDR